MAPGDMPSSYQSVIWPAKTRARLSIEIDAGARAGAAIAATPSRPTINSIGWAGAGGCLARLPGRARLGGGSASMGRSIKAIADAPRSSDAIAEPVPLA